MRVLNILFACEESQACCIEARKLGHNAFSCDILPCSGGHPEWHFNHDCLEVIHNTGGITESGISIHFKNWDFIVAFPPCTHLAVSGARHFAKKLADGRQQAGINFFLAISELCEKLNIPYCIENPVGIMSRVWRKPDQIIQPYYFGDPYQKTTCLWLYRLPKLYHNQHPDLFNPTQSHTNKGEFVVFASGKKMPKWYSDKACKGGERSKTFPGIAKAIAKQFSNYISNQSL